MIYALSEYRIGCSLYSGRVILLRVKEICSKLQRKNAGIGYSR